MDKKVLIISRNAWSNRISTGNTLSNFFEGWDVNCIANIFCRPEKIDNEVCDIYFRITENELLKSIFNNTLAGTEVYNEKKITNKEAIQITNNAKLYGFFRQNRLTIFLWGRELIWKVGNWKNKILDDFLDEFKPEIIYMPIYDCFYMHDILMYVKRKTGAAIVLFTGDDMYSLKQFSLSPLYWINRFILRKKIRYSVKIADKCYCLMPEQAEEYKKYFDKDFSLLVKEIKLDYKIQNQAISERKIKKIVYTGNVDIGRFEVLYKVGKELQKMYDRLPADLYIYSGSALSTKMKKCFSRVKSIHFMGEIDALEVQRVQQDADIVLHVESLKLKERLKTRLSFSTKIIDYMQNSCCILAIGWKEASSIQYLVRSKAAIIVTAYSELSTKIEKLLESNELREQLSSAAYQYVTENHQKGKNRKILIYDFEDICRNSNEEKYLSN